MNNTSHYNIKELKDDEVFVFGSNRGGNHGKGAAKLAKSWGAKTGQGEGLMGKTYGIPTKDEKLKVLSLNKIKKHIETFLLFAETKPELKFLVTEIGCGLAGYKPEDIAPLFFEFVIPDNVYLPDSFWRLENENLPD